MKEQTLEEKVQTEVKKRSAFDKIFSKIIIPVGVLSVAYLVNVHVCEKKYVSSMNQRNKTPAYQEFVKIDAEMKNLIIIDKDYNMYLSEKGKKDIEKRLKAIQERKEQLIPEIKPYEEQAEKWINRGLNPLEYFK